MLGLRNRLLRSCTVRSCTATGAERRQRDRLADFRRRRRIDQDLPVFGRAADVAAPFLADATDAAARDLHRQTVPHRACQFEQGCGGDKKLRSRT